MNLLPLLVLVSTGLGLTFALKSPLLCKDGKGNSFVCDIIANVNDNSAYPSHFSTTTDDITVARNGQDEFFHSLQALSILTRSLRSKINEKIPSTKDRLWLAFLNTANDRLALADYKTANLFYTAVSSIKRFQSALDDTNLKNADRIADTTSKAMSEVPYETDRLLVLNAANEHYKEMKQCSDNFVNELESLQNKTRLSVETYFDSAIDLLDQIGKCIESGPQAKCTIDARLKLVPLLSLSGKFTLDTAKFMMIAERKFDRYPCTVKAALRFNIEIRKLTRPRKTTTASYRTTSSNSTTTSASNSTTTNTTEETVTTTTEASTIFE